MSTVAYRAAVIRKVEQELGRAYANPADSDDYKEGRADALLYVLWMMKDSEDL